ncbi:uncharacterized protein Gasu_36970 [Galdieria sulphuraria]|uniref:Uncharacterized protein n=1 Tax=Galdieria sulphuraria TaxID=130081 RepID=M2VZN4_GALSU|nr:uncharacterized protein Gasu_36970 [Galdieria sulphuraria]EME28806.1 hypothetical protein Gasu_36970 [Galdieria sulphuraria]|eukprot:XP_005705326.1 hypothetical protein Gasu_36970 [Galdieria sulphuraria]
MDALEEVSCLDFANDKKTILDFAKGHRLSSSVALQVGKRDGNKNFCSLNSLCFETRDDLVYDSYLVELISESEGLYFCMKWVISEYIRYSQKEESHLFPCVIYIDTTASLSMIKWSDWMKQHGLHADSIKHFWNDFYYYRVVDAYELMALLKSLHIFFQQRNSHNWIILLDNFSYPLEPFECRGNLPYLFLYECYRITKMYNTWTFLVTNIYSSPFGKRS